MDIFLQDRWNEWPEGHSVKLKTKSGTIIVDWQAKISLFENDILVDTENCANLQEARKLIMAMMFQPDAESKIRSSQKRHDRRYETYPY
jgi:hypothetical protein